METNTQVQVQQNSVSASIFSSVETFEHWQRVAKLMSSSDIVPANYQNNIANTMIALELATRIGVSPFMIMQNLDIIKGKPSFNSTFIIAVLNSCGRFDPLRFVFQGKEGTDAYGCRAVTHDKMGIELKSPLINWEMVKAEGWLNKPGSKWKTMPELMFQYRAASFFGRLYAPDLLKGMHSVEEVVDVVQAKAENQYNDEDTRRAVKFLSDAESEERLKEVWEDYIDSVSVVATEATEAYEKREAELKEAQQ